MNDLKSKNIITLIMLLIGSTCTSAQIYVNVNALGANNGSSWTDAYTDLQDALAVAIPSDKIWVAQGDYQPSSSGDITKSFVMLPDVSIYGGFIGNETILSQRNWTSNLTVLSGYLGGNIRSRNVVKFTDSSIDNTDYLDGFTVSGGNSSNTFVFGTDQGFGSAIFIKNSSPTLQNIIISDNISRLGDLSIVAVDNDTHPQIVNCKFSSPGCDNNPSRTCEFTIFVGGIETMVTSSFATATFTNCLFWSNVRGCFFTNYNSLLEVTNCTFSNNGLSYIGPSRDGYLVGDFTLRNNIFWDDQHLILDGDTSVIINVDNNIFKNGLFEYLDTIATNTFIDDPIFVNPNFSDYRIKATSPAKDVGINSYNTTTTDIDNATRTFNGTIDLGAYESQIASPLQLIIYVDSIATGANDGTSWSNAFTDLNDALLTVDLHGIPPLIYLAKGTYYPMAYFDQNYTFYKGTYTFLFNTSFHLYGGFPSGGASFSNRNPKLYITKLDGQLTSTHVVTINLCNPIIDGVHIVNGYFGPNISSPFVAGAAIYISTFTVDTKPTISNCEIYNNTSNKSIIFISSYADIYNCRFYNNEIISFAGSLIHSHPDFQSLQTSNITNCLLFDNNTTSLFGFNFTSQDRAPLMTITNCTGNISNLNSLSFIFDTISINNSIFWGDIESSIFPEFEIIENSLVKNIDNSPNGGLDGTLIGNDPQFVDAPNGDLHLQATSPAIDQGNGEFAPDTDYDGFIRTYENAANTTDMGAYENGRQKLYIDPSSNVVGNGSSWASPITDLSDALNNSTVADSIFVAGGIYHPHSYITPPTRESSFEINNNYVLSGGYNPITGNYDPAHPSILSGEIGDPNSSGDNCKNVIVLNSPATIEGFIIEDGAATNTAGLRGRIGAGILSLHGGTFRNLIIRDNTSVGNFSNGVGAGLYSSTTPIHMENVLYHNNFSYGKGGAFAIENSSGSTLRNVTITGNTATLGGNAFHQYNSDMAIYNTIIYHNTNSTNDISQEGGASSTVTYSDIEGGYAGVGNINADPQFIQTSVKMYKPSMCSPTVNTGNATLTGSSIVDLFGVARLVNEVDMGAYEYYSATPRNGLELNLDDQTYSCTKNLEINVDPNQAGVTYTLLDDNSNILDGPLLSSENMLLLNDVNSQAGTYHILAQRVGYNALRFATSNHKMKVPYELEIALQGNENWTIMARVKLDNVVGRKRLYSQIGGIALGIDNAELIFTKYGIVDIISTGISINTGSYTDILMKHTILSDTTAEILLSTTNPIASWRDTIQIHSTISTADVYIGSTLSGVEGIGGNMEYLYLYKGAKEVAMYDFVDGKHSPLARDYRIVPIGEQKRNGELSGFDLDNDWLEGTEAYTYICEEQDTMSLYISNIPVVDTVINSSDTGYKSLSYYIGRSCPNDTIRFASNLMGDTVKFDSQIFLNNNLFIEGLGMDMNGTILDGQGQTRLFDSPTGRTVTYKDLQMINGSHPFSGGAFPVPNDCTIWNVRFKGHNASGDMKAMSIGSNSSLKIKGNVIIEE